MNAHWVVHAANPILLGHTVYGEPLLPGLAYVDMLYQLFRKDGHDVRRLRLRNLSIYRPLAVPAGERIELDVRATSDGDERWQVVVDGHDGRGAARRYATARMERTAVASFDETIDLQAIEASAGIDLDELYARCRQRELVHRDVMKADGVAYVTEDAVYVDCRLGEAARRRAKSFLFHPALLDAAAVCGSVSLRRGDPQDPPLALPLSFESFRAGEPLEERCIARLRRAALREGSDLRTMSLELFDPRGAKIAELERFASRVVRERRAVTGASAEPPAARPPRSPRPDGPSRRAGGVLPEAGDLEPAIRQLVADHLERPVEEIGPAVGFFDLGIDSAALLELTAAIERLVGRSLPPTLLFEHQTAARLAAHLARHHAPVLATPADTAPVDVAATVTTPAEAPPPPALEPVTPAAVPGAAIAVVGMAGRFPGARDVRRFWDNLKAGKDCVTEVPPERWDWRRYAALRSPSGKPLSRWGGFVDDPDCFDPRFFRMSPRQAELTDPQERLFLETCWEAMEDAGYTPRTLPGDPRRRVGVFAGVMHKDYTLIANDSQRAGAVTPLPLSNAAIANRVSYVCDFHGPSMIVDTVCSSSLVAVHLAVLNLRSGECDAALAGGVNLSLHPGKYLTYGLMDMQASDGRCRAFGSGGDGYVSSEAVGAVLLKTLDRALADGDHVYAVLRGSAINHVGAVSGFNVPSPSAQGDVIADCLERAGIDPRTVGYIEAHGTGTSLGDPIEIEGLTRAYGRRDGGERYAIGSVKSNIGHAESAAGVCGLIKTVLQLHHRTLVASLHADELNPHIDWDETPFSVQRETCSWDAAGPRRAAVSSFGATGTNVHLVLEEWAEGGGDGAVEAPDVPVVVPLSTKDEAGLRRVAERLEEHLGDDAEPVALSDLAYTLQVGREALEVRAAIVADSIATLREQLGALLRGERSLGRLVRGDAVGAGHQRDPFDDGDLDTVVQSWIDRGRLGKVAQLWVSGIDVPWERLRWGRTPRRVSLPTYPFERVRCWIPDAAPALPAAPEASTAALHPLLHANTSAFDEQRFTSTFTGDEWFLRDHVVGGAHVLPGVAALEMARAAVERAAGEGPMALHDVVWARPVVVDRDAVSVHIGLEEDERGEIRFDVYGGSGDETVVHAQGRASRALDAQPILDLDALRAACEHTHSADACYAALEAAGFRYGAAHRGVESLRTGRGPDGGRFVLAEVALPPSLEATRDAYVLHPSVLDGALQASTGLSLDAATRESAEDAAPLGMPFALGRAAIYAAVPARASVVVRRSAPSAIDVDVCDDRGRVSVRLTGLASRPVEARPSATVLLGRGWRAKAAARDRALPGERVLFAHPCYADRLGDRCEVLPLDGDDAARQLDSAAAALLLRLQQAAAAGGDTIVQVVVPDDEDTLAALAALLRTAEASSIPSCARSGSGSRATSRPATCRRRSRTTPRPAITRSAAPAPRAPSAGWWRSSRRPPRSRGGRGASISSPAALAASARSSPRRSWRRRPR